MQQRSSLLLRKNKFTQNNFRQIAKKTIPSGIQCERVLSIPLFKVTEDVGHPEQDPKKKKNI